MKRKILFALGTVLILSITWGLFYGLPRIFIDTKNTGFHRSIFQEAAYVSVKSYDGLNLEAFLLEPKKPKATIVLVHGLRACKEFYVERATELKNKGYRVLVPDLRAHGNSEGTYCTFGVKEKRDIKAWVGYISTYYPNQQIGIWGQSLGGAVALQAMGIEPRIKFGIIESTFSHFTDVGRDYLERYFGFRLKWLNDFIEWRVGSIGTFDPKEASPYESCKQISQPVLLVHAKKDERINSTYATKNFSVLNSKKKKLVLLSGARHNNVWQVGGHEYLEEVLTFITTSGK